MELQTKKPSLNRFFDFNGSEKDLENYILENIEDISENCGWGEISKIESQYRIKKGIGGIILDLMIWHEDGSGTVIEVKKSKSTRRELMTAISQCMFYGDAIERKFNFLPRMVIASDLIDYESYQVINRFKLPVNLLMIDGNRVIYLS